MVKRRDFSDTDTANQSIEVRMVFVGDPGVGKTSIILSLIKNELSQEDLPARVPSFVIPADITPERVPIYVADYSEREQTVDGLNSSIKEANVICVVYDASNDNTLARLVKYWLPLIGELENETGSKKQIILAANKIDLSRDDDISRRTLALVPETAEIAGILEVSTRTQQNVVQLLSLAQKTILYPIDSLYDSQKRALTDKCRNALIDIFKKCDQDGDGLLSDHELNMLQENCFGIPLQKDSLDDIKLVIKQSTIDGIVDNRMSQAGFLFLHFLSISKGRIDFTWQVLRKFNYDSQINLREGKAALKTSKSMLVPIIDTDLNNVSTISSSLNGKLDSQHRSETSLISNDQANFSLTKSRGGSWILGHQDFIYGAGFTIAAILSIIAFKNLVQGRRSAL